MPGDLTPEYVLKQLEKGQLSPFYLFYGSNEFRLERVLSRIRETFIPETSRDFNLRIFYGDKTEPADIIDTARSLPFMSHSRLIIVRRTESLSPAALESYIPYLDRPVESTCLIFVSSKTDFKRKFYRKVRELGQAVNFKNLSDRQVIPWIKKTAKELDLNIEDQACAYLQQLVGNRLMDLHAELEKLSLRYGKKVVGLEEVRAVAIFSRIYTVFELMDEVSFKRRGESISVLNRLLEEEGIDGSLKVLGMLNRQIRLLWQAKTVSDKGGRAADVSRKTKLPSFLVSRIVQQSKHWKTDDFERAFHLMYKADGLLKSGAHGRMVLENLVFSLCK
ncbi:MAG: DNA polymerase III subunit delta [Desulfobacterales bacterium]|nr:DNA polymerase III subunit delta [Desulfobacterales bacterium]